MFRDQLEEYEFILGSQSPQRLRIVKEQLKINNVRVVVSNFPEDLSKEGRTVEEYVLETCQNKLKYIVNELKDIKKRIILCSDTIVTCNGEIFEKPVDEGDHRRMFQKYKEHGIVEVFTAVTVVRIDGSTTQFNEIERTELEFDFGSDELVKEYIASGEGSKAAGGFQIQGFGNVFFPLVRGDYSNVVGLPVYTTFKMITGCL